MQEARVLEAVHIANTRAEEALEGSGFTCGQQEKGARGQASGSAQQSKARGSHLQTCYRTTQVSWRLQRNSTTQEEQLQA
eukprot:6083465-Prorocentrum_lima.AAC.1